MSVASVAVGPHPLAFPIPPFLAVEPRAGGLAMQGGADCYVDISRPVYRPAGTGFETRSVRLFDPGLPSPEGMMVVEGAPVDYLPPPSISLNTHDPMEILRLLEYAGIWYKSPLSQAAVAGVEMFRAGREFALKTDRQAILFDWDHTIDNYKIFERLLALIRTKTSRGYPYDGKGDGDYPLTSLETARPLMHEWILGMMVGFAIRQGLQNFTEWEEKYRPQVGLATLTWPDRLGVLSRCIPLIALMDGRFPGRPDNYVRTVNSRTFVHLHDFLGYAESLLEKFKGNGFHALTPAEQDEVIAYLRRGKGHYLKPPGAIREKWATGALMLFDDSDEAFQFYQQETVLQGGALAVYTQNPYTRPGEDVPESEKISVGLTRRSRMGRAARELARAESRTAVPALAYMVARLGSRHGTRLEWRREDPCSTPSGVILRLHEVGTTLREFHRHYVEPTNRVKETIREIRRRAGEIVGVGGSENTR